MSGDQKRPERIKNWFKKIIKKYGDIQKNLTEQTQEVGYSKDVFEKASNQFNNISDDPILGDVEKTLSSHYAYLSTQGDDLKRFLNQARMGSYIAFSTASTASVSAAIIPANFVVEKLKPPSSWKPERRQKYVAKMSRIDRELGKTYASVWETFYVTQESPEKVALYAMRQTFDHLFRIIAPDEEVRKSPYFSEKEGNKPKQVYREERLQYAACKKVKKIEIGELLASKTKQTLDNYDKLNKMHTEKTLKREDVIEILTSMQSVLEEWIDAIVPIGLAGNSYECR